MSMRARKKVLEQVALTQRAILSNARCLTEGINLPSVDAVALLTPKKSRIGVAQAIGRAMRKDPKNPDKKDRLRAGAGLS